MDFCNTIDLFSRYSLLFRILFLIRILAELPATLSGATWFSSALPAKVWNRTRVKSSPNAFRCPQKSDNFLTVWRLNVGSAYTCTVHFGVFVVAFDLMRARNMKMRAMQEDVSVPSYGDNTRSRRTATHKRTVDMVNYKQKICCCATRL
jgi:hypothetical protein